MGLFNIFNKAKSDRNGIDGGLVDIPKDIFIEDRDANEGDKDMPPTKVVNGIESVYAFLQDNYEARGYNDALVSPDDSYKRENIKLIRYDLEILLQQVTTYYEDSVRIIDFHVKSRMRAGLVDLVEELNTRKETIIEHMSKVNGIRQEMESDTGMTQRILLSYQRGFMRGLSALTQAKVF